LNKLRNVAAKKRHLQNKESLENIKELTGPLLILGFNTLPNNVNDERK
jgi:hypothetical protein